MWSYLHIDLQTLLAKTDGAKRAINSTSKDVSRAPPDAMKEEIV